MSQLYLRMVLVVTLMIGIGSQAMDLSETKTESPLVTHDLSNETEKSGQIREIIISKERVDKILARFLRHYFLSVRVSLPDLKLLIFPNSVLPDYIKTLACEALSDPSEEEIRFALEGYYSELRISELYECFILISKVHHLPYSMLENLIVPNSVLPENIKADAWEKLSDATEEEMRLTIKKVYNSQKNPSIKFASTK